MAKKTLFKTPRFLTKDGAKNFLTSLVHGAKASPGAEALASFTKPKPAPIPSTPFTKQQQAEKDYSIAKKKSDKANNPFVVTANEFKAIPSEALKTGKKIATFGKEVAQGIARTVGTVGTEAGNLPTRIANALPGEKSPLPFDAEIPTTGSKVTEAVFGGKPIRSFESAGKNAAAQVDALRSTIAGGREVKPIDSKYAIPLGVAGSLLDLSGLGGEKQAAKEVFEKLAEKSPIIKQTILNIKNSGMAKEEFVQRFKGAVEGGNEIAQQVSEVLTKTKRTIEDLFDHSVGKTADKKIVEQSIKNADTPQDALKLAEEKAGMSFKPKSANPDMAELERLAAKYPDYQDFSKAVSSGEDKVLPFYGNERPSVTNDMRAVFNTLKENGYGSMSEFHQKTSKAQMSLKNPFSKVPEAKKVTVRNSEIKLPDNPTPRQKELSAAITKTEQEIGELETSYQIKQDVFDSEYSKYSDLGKYISGKEGGFPGQVGNAPDAKFTQLLDTPGFREKYGLNTTHPLDELTEKYDIYKAKKAELEDINRAIREKNKSMSSSKNEILQDKRVQINSAKDEVALNKMAAKDLEAKARIDERKAIADAGIKKGQELKAAKVEKEHVINNAFEQAAIPQKTSLIGAIKKKLQPFKYTDEETQALFKEWEGKTNLAKETARDEAKKLAHIPEKESWDTILKYQKGVKTPYSAEIQKVFDDLHALAKNKDVDLPYRKNYIPQVWQGTPDEIAATIRKYLSDQGLKGAELDRYLAGKPLSEETAASLKLSRFYEKARVFNTYEEGMAYGLKPKYTNIAQLAAHYRQVLEETVANKEFIDGLARRGKILVDAVAPKGWKYINVPAFEGYKAPAYLASTIENLFKFAPESFSFTDRFIHGLATISRRGQEIALSGGIPKTNINFFSMGQAIKEMTRGNFRALPAFIRANSNKASLAYFEKNAPYLKKMAENGIDVGGRIGNYKDIYKNVVTKDSFKKIAGDKFDEWFNEKTFASFMPQLYTQTFKSSYTKMIEKGLSEAEAGKFAADVTRKTFGLIEDWGRSAATKDKLSAVFFAPHFREGIINTLLNTGKSITTELRNPLFKNNRKLALGMVLTFGAYNVLNKELNGHYMWENPKNRQFALRIPINDGKDAVYIEFMPSFLSFARNILAGGIATAKGDFNTAGQKIGSVFSMPIKTITEVLTNKDYFDREIYSDDDSTTKKIGKIVEYTGLTYNHPFIKEMVKYYGIDFTGKSTFPYATTKKKEDRNPLYQSLLMAAEMPVKFGSQATETKNQYYDEVDARSSKMKKENEKYRPKLEEIRTLRDSGDKAGAEAMFNALTEDEKAIIKRLSTADKAKKTKERKVELYQTLLEIRKAKDAGDLTKANELFNNLDAKDQELLVTVSKEHPKNNE